MKKFKSIILILTLAALFTACGEVDSNSEGSEKSAASLSKNSTTNKQQINEAIRKNPNIDKNAEISTFIDEDGNEAFTYANPNGQGGGGGVIVD